MGCKLPYVNPYLIYRAPFLIGSGQVASSCLQQAGVFPGVQRPASALRNSESRDPLPFCHCGKTKCNYYLHQADGSQRIRGPAAQDRAHGAESATQSRAAVDLEVNECITLGTG